MALLIPAMWKSKELSLGRKFRGQLRPLLTYLIPTAFFLYFPGQIAQVTSSAVGTSAAAASSPSSSPMLFAVALFASYNPVVSMLMVCSLALLMWSFLRRREATTGLALLWTILGLAVIGGIIVVFRSSGGLPISTAVRYSYDAIPAYFVAAPFGLARLHSKKKLGLLVVIVLVYGALAANSSQGYLQSSLGTKYPFLSGEDQFLYPTYLTPYARLRDFFSTLQGSQPIYVVGDAGLDAPCWPAICYHNVFNLTSDWQNTPGTSKIGNIAFYGYENATTLASQRLTGFYLYIDRSDWGLFNSSNSYLREIALGNQSATNGLPFRVAGISVIYNRYDFYLARVDLSYQSG